MTVERELPHPAEKVWRALTVPHFIEAWLLRSDFSPVVGRDFKFTQSWGEIACTVTAVDPPRRLAYTWSAFGLDSTVTFTLTPTASGTLLRMEQVGFRTDQEQAFKGARAAWRDYLKALDALLAGVE